MEESEYKSKGSLKEDDPANENDEIGPDCDSAHVVKSQNSVAVFELRFAIESVNHMKLIPKREGPSLPFVAGTFLPHEDAEGVGMESKMIPPY